MLRLMQLLILFPDPQEQLCGGYLVSELRMKGPQPEWVSQEARPDKLIMTQVSNC